MEEKNGKIVEIVESTEVQKQQKKNKRNLRIMIASLIVAGSVGYGAMNLSRGDSKEEQPAVSTEYQISSELDGVEISNISTDKDGKTAEEAKSIPSLYAVVTSKDGKTTDTSYVLTADTNKVKLEENQRLVLIEKYDDEKEHPNCLFQKQTRDVSIDGENNLASSGEWQSTDEYVIGYSAPVDSVDTRYIFTGTLSTVLENNPVIEMPHVVLSNKTKDSDKTNSVRLDNREDAISTLTSMGMSKEEALEKVRAAEEQAAREKGAITEEVAKELQHPSSGQQEIVQPNQPSFPSIQSPVLDERQQFLDKINQKITEMNQMLDNTDVNEQSVSEGKTR